jgi:ATP-dependent exoDNAse (exonuclease V) beta subunit
VIGDERRDGWLQALHPAVYPDISDARRPESRQPDGCPELGEDSVPGRPGDVRRPIGSVMPGLHTPEAGDHRVVWWDPSKLELGVRTASGLVQTRILEADTGGRADAALREWTAWREARERTRESGIAPSRVVRAATEWSRAMTEEGSGAVGLAERNASAKVELLEVSRASRNTDRPRGVRFGTLVHALLATVDLADRGGVAAHGEVQATLLGATDEERDAAVRAVASALEHPLLRRAVGVASATPGFCRRETPLLVKLEDGTLIECVADLAFLDETGWTVVDFKTDAEPGPRLERYRHQVALYARGIDEATGVKARAVLMKI